MKKGINSKKFCLKQKQIDIVISWGKIQISVSNSGKVGAERDSGEIRQK